MQVSIETTSGLERRMKIGVPAERVDDEVNKRLQKAAKTIRIDGFRPGKVPMSIIKKRYGAGLRQEVLAEVINSTFVEAATQEKVNPIAQPTIETTINEPGKDLEFTATFEVLPEVSLANFDDYELERVTAEVTDADIDKMVEALRHQKAEWKSTKRKAQKGDRLTIDFVGIKDGEAFEGGSAEGTELILGSDSMIPGFESGLIGAKPGESVTLDLTFPEDYQATELAGKEVQFTVNIKSSEQPILPAIDDDFLKLFGIDQEGEDGVTAFREEIKQNMTHELNRVLRSKAKNAALDALSDKNELDIPQAMIKQEIHSLKHQAVQRFGGTGNNIDPHSLPDDMFKDQAEKRVKVGLLVREVIKKFELKADPDAVRSAIDDIAASYEKPEEVVNWYYSNQEQLSNIEASVLEDAVVETIYTKVKVTDKTGSYEDVVRPIK